MSGNTSLYIKDSQNTLDNGGTKWVPMEGTAGAANISDGALAFGPIYENATYKFFGEAVPGTALTAASWRVSRMNIADSQIEWADGNGNFDNVFTSLAVVAALSFS